VGGREVLQKAFDSVDASLRKHDASLLVAANAELRDAGRGTGE
jgi:hypothetical protein